MGVRRDEPIALKGLQRQLDELDTRMAALQSESATLEARL
jgi:hypothetical protein